MNQKKKKKELKVKYSGKKETWLYKVVYKEYTSKSLKNEIKINKE